MSKHWGAALALVACGCTTHLQTRPVATGTTPMVGVPYALPALQYEVTITRTLSECTPVTTLAEKGVDPKFKIAIEAAPRHVAGETFIADYRAMASWTKTSAFAIATHPNQTLKTVNVAAKDESPEIIAEVAKAVFMVAQGVYGVPLAAASVALKTMKRMGSDGVIREISLDDPLEVPTCPAALKAIEKWQAQIDTLAGEIKEQTKLLNQYKVSVALGTTSDADNAEITKLVKAIAAKSDAMALLQGYVAEESKALSLKETAVLNPRSGALAQQSAFLFPSADATESARQLKWLSTLFGIKKDQLTEVHKELYEDKLDAIATLLSLAPEAVPGSTLCNDANLADDCELAGQAPDWNRRKGAKPLLGLPGIAYRIPTPVRLRICAGKDGAACNQGDVKSQATHNDLAPQLGRLVVLPFQNGFGANNNLKAAFRIDGSLDTLEYGMADGSTGRDVATTLTSVAGQALAFEQARQAKKVADRAAEKAEATAALDEQIAVLTKQKELLELQAATGSDIAALQAELARLQALKAIKELEAYQ